MQPVGIDDACMFLAEFENGSMGTFESTRYARGRKNYNTFELNGADGSVFFDLEEPEYLQYFEYTQQQSGKKTESHLTGWRKIHIDQLRAPVHESLVGAGHDHRLRAHVPECTGRLRHGHRVRQARRSPISGTRCRRRRSATRCFSQLARNAGFRPARNFLSALLPDAKQLQSGPEAAPRRPPMLSCAVFHGLP